MPGEGIVNKYNIDKMCYIDLKASNWKIKGYIGFGIVNKIIILVL